MDLLKHESMMEIVLNLAQKAYDLGEVPVAAILVDETGVIVEEAHNSRETSNDPCGHAEINCLRNAGKKLNTWNLQNHILYVNLEPCIMCMGALINSRIKLVVYGAHDKKSGSLSNLWFHPSEHTFNHQVQLISGILEDKCSQIMHNFFTELRFKKKKESEYKAQEFIL